MHGLQRFGLWFYPRLYIKVAYSRYALMYVKCRLQGNEIRKKSVKDVTEL